MAGSEEASYRRWGHTFPILEDKREVSNGRGYTGQIRKSVTIFSGLAPQGIASPRESSHGLGWSVYPARFPRDHKVQGSPFIKEGAHLPWPGRPWRRLSLEDVDGTDPTAWLARTCLFLNRSAMGEGNSSSGLDTQGMAKFGDSCHGRGDAACSFRLHRTWTVLLMASLEKRVAVSPARLTRTFSVLMRTAMEDWGSSFLSFGPRTVLFKEGQP